MAKNVRHVLLSFVGVTLLSGCLPSALKEELPDTFAFSRSDLRELLQPINGKYKEVQTRIDYLFSAEGWADYMDALVRAGKIVRPKKMPEVKGRVGVIYSCYSERGDIDIGSCKTGKDLSGDKVLQITSINPLLGTENAGREALVPFSVRDVMLEIVTIDPNQSDELRRAYFFGEPRFDLIYLAKLGYAIKQTKEKVKRGGKNALDIKELAEASKFVVNFLKLLADLGDGTADILEQATRALRTPDLGTINHSSHVWKNGSAGV